VDPKEVEAVKRTLWIMAAALGTLAAAAEVPAHSDAKPSSTNPPAAAARTGAYSLPGSDKHFTQAQIDDLKSPPDWFPQAHPPAPTAVKGGVGPFAWACGSCHLMSGMGHPESARLAGKPVAYLMRRIQEYRVAPDGPPPGANGKPLDGPPNPMPTIAKAWPESEIKAAIEYFAFLKPIPWVKVVESDIVPKSYVNATFMRIQAPGNGAEPLGRRIVELPQNLERALLRDPTSGTVAYVPAGAVARGKALVTQSALPCASCHGADLKGQGDVPGIAGQSPFYTRAQLAAFKSGTRNGAMTPMMRAAVDGLSAADMIDIAAYLGTLPLN
jgi:cytochrome c553